jgi:hypothetical protein
MKTIRLSEHAREQIFYRGTTEEEVIETIKTSQCRMPSLEGWSAEKILFLKIYGIRSIIRLNR